MHHRRGRDYKAANVGWLWKQRHVYVGAETESNYTGDREINRYGDSTAVGFCTDRYRYAWQTHPRVKLPQARHAMFLRKATVTRNSTNTTLGSASVTTNAHTLLTMAFSARFATFSWPATISTVAGEVSDTFDVAFPSATTVAVGTTARDRLNANTEVAMVRV